MFRVLGLSAILHLYRKRAAAYLNHRCTTEILGKTLYVDGRAGHDHFQISTLFDQALQVTQQKIDIQTAFVSFINDDDIVLLEKTILTNLCQQQAVSHHLDQGFVLGLIGKTHRIPDFAPDFRSGLLCDALGHRAGSDPTGLGMTDDP